MKAKLVLGILALFLMAACATQSETVVQQEKIKIGLIAPLTGPFAEWGSTIREGMELVLEDTEHKFVVDYQDSVCEPPKTVTIAQKFFNVDGIKIVIGPGCVTGLRAIAPLAEEQEALLFSTGLLDDAIFQEYDSVINLATQISTEADHMAEYLGKNNMTSMVIIHGTNYFGEEYGRRLPEVLEKNGIEVKSIHPTDLDTIDFRTIILKVKEDKPDAVYIHQSENAIGQFAKQLRQSNSQIPIYSTYAAEAQSVLESGGESLEELKYTYPVNIAEESEKKKEFEKRYAEKFGKDKVPSATSFFVYDGLILLDKAMNECQPNDTQCIAKFFKTYGEYEGLSGYMKFEQDGSLTRSFGIKKIENGTFVWVTKEI